MGQIRDIARVGRTVARDDSSDILGVAIYMAGFIVIIILFFVFTSAYVKYKRRKRLNK